MKLKQVILYIVLFVSFTGLAQVKFEAEASKEKMGVNERLRVDFSVNQDGDNFNPPDFKGFKVIGGPNQSISQSYVNGKMSFQKKYSYFLQPNGRGKFKIGQATIEIEGQTYKTPYVDIEVTAAVNTPTEGTNPEIIAADNIHLVAEISNRNPYLNEGISVRYKLYFSPKVNVRQWYPKDNPKYADFWSQNIDIPQLSVKEDLYKGDPYQYVVIRETVLYPQKTGELKIEPLTLTIPVNVPSDRRDIFGRRLYETVERTVASNTQTIDVKALPTAGRPANFTGAVGSFNFKATSSKDVLDATESLQIKLQVSGKGNLKLFQLPKLKVPASLEVYEPEHQENVNTNLSGMYGNISDTYTVVPQLKGKYPINELNFSYFDPRSETYKMLTSEEILLNVENGPVNNTNPVTTSASGEVNKQAVASAPSQFRYIQLDANLQPANQQMFFKSIGFWTALISPLLLIPIGIFTGKKRKALAGNVEGNKSKKANKLAKKYLSEAKKNLGEQKSFYIALERALHNYLKAKLSIQTGEMSKDKIKDLLEQKGIDAQATAGFIKLLESCELARYTPSSKVEMQQDYDKSVKIISELDKQL
ncbi:Oxygen tolerance [Mesonia phycicola]|uniref:Oxygen tolerance n=1 Tax=Mesonia phycicola TaxID=579105 RepID=A0A1M6CUE4_9FLAO|nr:BatD family protein [Mesonia phycicola]SHI64570.1 Oxygen tolerance [Mesonia phycicola]